jgi:homoisocitrate dehydrogenase
MRQICVIPADGVGQEVVPAAVRVLQATGVPLSFVSAEAGWDCFVRRGMALPDETVEAVAASSATLFGATQSPSHKVEGYQSPILALRRRFNLYANIRPARSLPIGGSRPGIDMVIVRENTEGLYAGRERREGDVAITERVISRAASERIAKVAYGLAHQRAGHRGTTQQPRVVIVHKANVLKETDGLFRESVRAVAADYPGVATSEMLVDAMAMRLIRDPESFDVIVTPNLFGDILSDEAAALVGGLGVAASGNIGDFNAIYEPVHGSAPDIAGKGIANPVGAILSAAMMLERLGDADAANRVQASVEGTLAAGILTPDLGGGTTTEAVTSGIIARLKG